MVVKALLIGISLWEAGMLYWLLCGTVLQIKYFREKEWIILCMNVAGVGINAGINRSIIFFSQDMFIIGILCTCICVMMINGQNKLFKIIIITLNQISLLFATKPNSLTTDAAVLLIGL